MLEDYRNGLRPTLPKAVEDCPLLEDGLELYWRAFWDLLSCRTFNGEIPWTAIDHWATRHELDFEQRELLTFHLRAMEEEHRAYREEHKPKK